jgi:hypothetical protein
MTGPGKKRPGKRPGPADADRRRGIAKSLAVRAAMPKCGAKRRTDGMPCRHPVKEEGSGAGITAAPPPAAATGTGASRST